MPALSPALSIVGLAGNITSPSKTRALVATALDLASQRLDARTELFEIADFGEDLGRARRLSDLSEPARARVEALLAADALVVATPIYKGSYPGLFKHLIDLLDPAAFLRKPVLIAATGGGERHALAVEHQLRPLFAFFEARVLSTAVHVSDKDFTDGRLTGAAALERLGRAVEEFELIFPAARALQHAAE
ncbi:NAD(P)H-dependent oxidoreductase [Paenirhodobacter sp.]|uniref:NAD(P)H-dependent oxidoreductase n=1 Tax=Paenirhodobacter sp. TaxID=1965326 RepID=UPI003B50EADD